MFLILLGGTLTVGAGLLAAASYSDGALVASRTTAQVIGWLLVFAAAVALKGLPRATFAEISAMTIAFFSGSAMLYVAYFEWSEIPATPVRHAAAEALPIRQPDYKFVDEPLPVVTPASVRLALTPVEIPRPLKERSAAVPPALASVPPAVATAPRVAAAVASPRTLQDPCSSLAGVESLQCRRCGDKAGLWRIVCHESARLEYCQGRPADDATCPSAIPYSPPG